MYSLKGNLYILYASESSIYRFVLVTSTNRIQKLLHLNPQNLYILTVIPSGRYYRGYAIYECNPKRSCLWKQLCRNWFHEQLYCLHETLPETSPDIFFPKSNYRICRSISRSSSTITTCTPRGVRLMYRMCCVIYNGSQSTTRLDTWSIARLWQANAQATRQL